MVSVAYRGQAKSETAVTFFCDDTMRMIARAIDCRRAINEEEGVGIVEAMLKDSRKVPE